MAPRTIAERAAAGENLRAQDLTREEQGELLLWARNRQPPMPYREIIRRYGFTLTEGGLRHWYHVLDKNKPPRVATFTTEDVSISQFCTQNTHYYKYYLPLLPPFNTKQGANTKSYGLGRASPTSGHTLRDRPSR